MSDWIYFATSKKASLPATLGSVLNTHFLWRSARNAKGFFIPNVGHIREGDRIVVAFRHPGRRLAAYLCCRVAAPLTPVDPSLVIDKLTGAQAAALIAVGYPATAGSVIKGIRLDDIEECHFARHSSQSHSVLGMIAWQIHQPAMPTKRESFMQGEKIGEESGKVTSRRVLANPDGSPKMETTVQTNLTLLGVKATSTVTYWSVVRPDGTLYGEGHGIVMSKEGDVATFIGQGVGTVGKAGGVSFRGALYYQSSSPKWSRLNSVAGIYEHDVDGEGNVRSQSWEWK